MTMDPMSCPANPSDSWYDDPSFWWMFKCAATLCTLVLVLAGIYVLYELTVLINRAKVTVVIKDRNVETGENEDKKRN